jgi:hypothetical protein
MGELVVLFGAKTSNACDRCNKKGVLNCSECKKGRIVCGSCAGKGRCTGPCPVCFSTRKALCGGCTFDSVLAWTTTGERLAAAGMGPAALAHFDVAIARIERRNEARVHAATGSEQERRTLAKELEKEAVAVKTRRAALAASLGL